MEIVIDAQVVWGYFKEAILELEPSLTGRAEPVFERLGSEDLAFLDQEGHIEHEWRSVIDREWFDPWYARLLSAGAATLIPVETCNMLRKQLERLGFPRSHKDIWYVRTAKAVADHYGQVIIVTEDMHFYDPTQKKTNAKHRRRILLSGDGQVARYLRRKECIDIRCVAGYCELMAA
jgi:hypothetical protein